MSNLDPNIECSKPLVKKPTNGSGPPGTTSSSIPSNGNHGRSSSSSSSRHRSGLDRTKSEEAGEHFHDDDGSPSSTRLGNSERDSIDTRLSKLQVRLYALAAVATIGLLVLIIVVVVLYAKLHNDLAHHTHRPGLGQQMSVIMKPGLCVPCSHFRLGPRSNTEMERQLEQFKDEGAAGGDSCCADEPEKLFDMFKMYIDKQFRLELAKGTVPVKWDEPGPSDVRPAAHLMIGRKDLSRKDKSGRLQMINQWLFEGDMAFLSGDVQYDNGHIVVPQDGHYYVYSQISFIENFKTKQPNDIPDSQNSLSIYLYRYNIIYSKGPEEKLAQNSISRCVSRGSGLEEYTISLGAVFNLRRQDYLLIKVSNISMVYHDVKSNYFGLFKV